MNPDRPEINEAAASGSEQEKDHQHEHTLVVRITYDTKKRLDQLAIGLDRTNSDIVRMVLRLGIPLLESLSEAEQQVVRDYTDIFRKLRQMRSLRDV
jgi:predicted DNA-binding protein